MITTTKTSEYEKTIKVDLTKSPSASDDELANFLPKKPIYKWRTFNLALFIILGVILLFSFIHVPYCGSYIDAYIFEYSFGNAKFIIYLYLFVLVISKIFNLNLQQIMLSKKMILSFLLLLFSLIIILCISQQLIKDSVQFSFHNFSRQIKDYTNAFNDHVNKDINNINYYFWGLSSGFLGVVFGELMLVIVIIVASIVALIIFIISILILTNKTQTPLILKIKKWFIKKIGFDGRWMRQNELNNKPEDIKTNFIKNSEIRNEAINSRSNTPPISFLTDTSVDNYLRNKLQAKQYCDKITAFLKQFDSIIQYQKTIIMPTFIDIVYDVENEEIINDVLASQNAILNELKIDSFNVIIKNKTLHFEIKNTNLSKISLKAVLSLNKDATSTNIVLGVNTALQPLTLDISRKNNLILVGTNGSGMIMSLIIFLINLAYVNSPDDMQINIMSTISDKAIKRLEQIPHLTKPISFESSQITQTLIQIQNELDKREALFKNNNVKNFDTYNSLNVESKIKKMIVVILNFNTICKISLQNKQLIHDILFRGRKYGIKIILASHNVDSEFLDKDLNKVIDAKIIYKLDFEQESINVFNNQRGVQLFGNGDGFYFDCENQTKERFQACYMNVNELNTIIKIIQTFYSTKAKFE